MKKKKFIFSIVKCLSFVFKCLWAEGKSDRERDENCNKFLSCLCYGQGSIW